MEEWREERRQDLSQMCWHLLPPSRNRRHVVAGRSANRQIRIPKPKSRRCAPSHSPPPPPPPARGPLQPPPSHLSGFPNFPCDSPGAGMRCKRINTHGTA
eukprot:262770-Hanusia_phi.AAC.3